MKVIGKFFSIFFILAISTVIFFLVEQNQSVKDDILISTLKLFGDDLIKIVPAGEQRNALEAKYNDFLARAKADQVPPEDIQRVAVQILNLSNTGEQYSSDQVIQMLDFPRDSAHLRSRRPFTPPRQMTPRERRELASRLERMDEFQRQLERKSREDSVLRRMRSSVFYQIDSSDVRVVLRMQAAHELAQQHQHLERTLKKLEALDKLPEEHQQDWMKDIQHSLKDLEFDIKIEMDSSWANISGDSLMRSKNSPPVPRLPGQFPHAGTADSSLPE